MAAHAVPVDREARNLAALTAATEGLRLARRELQDVVGDKARCGWVALGLISALKGFLVAALSAYETAGIDAVTDPADAERVAPVALLLRRAKSEDYLNAADRVVLTGAAQRAVERITELRNAAVHALPLDVPDSFESDALAVVALIGHLVPVAAGAQPLLQAFAETELAALRTLLGDGGA